MSVSIVRPERAYTRSIVVANIGEFDVRFMGDAFTRDDRRLWNELGIELADMALFWCGDNKVVVSPRPYDLDWLSDVSKWLGFRNVHNVSPVDTTDSLSLDSVADVRMLEALMESLQGVEAPELVSWGAVSFTYELLDALRSSVAILAPELPPRDALWSVD